jgi:flagellar hook-length control protein FliK
MPDIAPLLATTPAPPAPTSGMSVLPLAPVAADGPSLDFLSQLTAALKGLAAAVSPMPPAASRAQTPAPPAPAEASDALPAESDPAPKVSDTSMDELPELLAMLGIVVVPPALQPLVAAAPDAAASGGVEPAPVRATPPPDAPTAATVELPSSSQPGVATKPETTGLTSQTGPEVASPVTHGSESRRARSSPSDSASAAPATPTDTAAAMPATPPVVAERSTPADRAQTPRVVSASSVALTQAQPPQDSAPQSGDAGDGHQRRSNKSIGAIESTSADSTTSVGNDDRAFNAAMSQATAPTGAPVPAAAVHSSGVVSQIVHQAELYRLPGNRGVRIQLHPEDLGGVQVTLRYAAGGGLELHIDVEHAATGSLVQQGWTELRDALATQGINPDRLVMSVSGPDSATQLDFSSGGGGSSRSDAGLAQFGQGGQSDRQHQQAAEAGLTSRAWSGRFEPTSAAEATVATSAAASRIDYRA